MVYFLLTTGKIIITQLTCNKLTLHQIRIGLLQDINLLCRGGYVKTSLALNFISKLTHETEYLVWGEISSFLLKIENVFWEDKEISDAIKDLSQTVFGPIADSTEFDVQENESSDERELRSIILNAAARVGYEPYVFS